MADENRTTDDLRMKKPTALPPTHKAARKAKEGHGGPGLDSSYPLGLALSGGGHRASLFGLGVLMAMRDAGRRPIQISSVSGGSITNAFLAYRYFAKVPNDQSADETLWEHETQRLFETIINKGVVTKAWIRFLLAFLILPPVLFVVMALLGVLPPWQITILSGFAWTTVLFLRGLLIEWLISRRYFAGFLFKKVDLAAIGHSKTEHVICCTDLVTGRPLYASTRDGGQIFRTFVDRPVGIGPRTVKHEEESHGIQGMGVLYSAPTLSVATVVRASAGFPGIPPRRVQLNSFERASNDRGKYTNMSSLAFLSDGGIWNNLATQPFEDGFLWGDYGPWVVVVADASASLDYEKPVVYHIPMLAEFRALVRQAVIQNINTVGPRRSGHHDWIRRELSSHRSARFSSERLYPVVSCMELPEEVKARLESAAGDNPTDTFLEQSEREWREKLREKTRMRALDLERATDVPKPLTEEIHIDPHAASNFRRLSDLSAVGASAGDANTRDSVSTYPTTLDKIERATAVAIVGRGYANTAITLYLTGLVDELVFPKGWLGKEKETITKDR